MAEDILYKFKKFAKRSREAYSDMYERIRSDRSFMSGDGQWTKEDDGFIEKTRNRVTVNVLANQVHSVANKYSSFPFTWYTGNADIDKEIDDFFAEDSNRFATEEALLDCVSFGLGVLCLGTDTTADGRDVPVIYAITDPERVMLDPDSTELDGSDAMEGALIDYRSKEWIRVHMGEQYVPEKRAKPVFAGAFAKPGLIPIVTYYYLDTDGCHVATFVNDMQVEDEKPEEEIQLEEGIIEGDGVAEPEGAEEITETDEPRDVLPIKRIPIFPVLGERTWTESDNIIYRGLIAKGKTVQRIVNYSMTQLIERLQLSPKPQFRGYLESFKNLDKYYKKAGTGINPILPGQRLANDGKTQLPLPEVYNPNIQFADLQQITNGTMEMLTSITGVDSKGLANNESEITATAVLYTSQVFQNNIKHFFSHLRTSFKALGDTVMVLLGHAGQKIDVAQGPEAYMQLQIARQELTSLVGIVEANQKPAIVNAILKTHPDNEILAQLFAELNAAPQPTEMEAQQAEVIEQMKQAIEQKDQEIINLTAQVEDYARSERSQDKSILADMAKSEQQHEFKLEEMAVQAELEAGADAVKIAADADKAQMDVESKAVALETQKIKSASEIFKTLGTGV
jgi:hypothetical protein